MKRVLLLIVTNLAVMVVLSIVVSVLGFDRWLTANGIDYFSLLVFSAIFGFGGAFISLLMSKFIAKMSVGAQVIDGSEGTTQYWLVQTAPQLAGAAHLGRAPGALFEGPADGSPPAPPAPTLPAPPPPMRPPPSPPGGRQPADRPDTATPCATPGEPAPAPLSAPPPPIEARIAALQNPQ